MYTFVAPEIWPANSAASIQLSSQCSVASFETETVTNFIATQVLNKTSLIFGCRQGVPLFTNALVGGEILNSGLRDLTLAN